MDLKAARYFEKGKDKKTKCFLCPQGCYIDNNGIGFCGVRKNIDGVLYALSYGLITAIAIDPIEKKPLTRYKPGSNILSIGMAGCNLTCTFCQNYTISQGSPDAHKFTPEMAVKKALELKEEANNIGIAYTYNEPLIAYEYVYDAAKLVKESGMDNVVVTNGYICEEPFKDIVKYLDALNIDLKAFNNKFYKNICGGRMEPVIKSIEEAAKHCHVEVTCLVIPGENDSRDEIGEMAKVLSGISGKITLHLTRFFPNYKMNKHEPTPIDTLRKLKDEANKYLDDVIIGNV